MTKNTQKNISLLLFVLCIVSLVLACGPIKTTLAIKDVNATMAEADELNAANKVASAYQYWAAKEHLSKARLTHGYSDFDASEKFAQKAQKLADQAVSKAKKGKQLVYEPKLNGKSVEDKD